MKTKTKITIIFFMLLLLVSKSHAVDYSDEYKYFNYKSGSLLMMSMNFFLSNNLREISFYSIRTGRKNILFGTYLFGTRYNSDNNYAAVVLPLNISYIILKKGFERKWKIDGEGQWYEEFEPVQVNLQAYLNMNNPLSSLIFPDKSGFYIDMGLAYSIGGGFSFLAGYQLDYFDGTAHGRYYYGISGDMSFLSVYPERYPPSFEVRVSFSDLKGNSNEKLNFNETCEIVLDIKNTSEWDAGPLGINIKTEDKGIDDSFRYTKYKNLGRFNRKKGKKIILPIQYYRECDINEITLVIESSEDKEGYYFKKRVTIPVDHTRFD